MSRQVKVVPPPLPAAGDPEELSREAVAAALVDLPDDTADLVGWVTDGRTRERGPANQSRARRVLAAALGVGDDALTMMDDADVVLAMDRLRALVDKCARLEGQATVDELTGTLRRGAGLAALQREMDRSRRVPGKGLAVIFIDLDGLKAVNDRQGHAAGDGRLRATVAAIRERLRSYDLIVRYGGDEFICVLTDSAAAEAERTAATLREQVLQRTGSTISVGVAELAAGESVDSLVEHADAALYAGRRARAVRSVRARR